MKIAHPDWEVPIEFKENILNTLVIENPALIRRYIEMMINQMQGITGDFVLSEQDNILDISKKLDVISDYFHLELNNRKILTKFYSYLAQSAINEDFYVSTSEIKTQLTRYVQSLLDEVDEELTFESEIDVVGILKLLDVKFQQNDISLCEKVIAYLNLMRNYIGIQCFVFINIRSFFDEYEIGTFYEYICYNKFNVLFIENHCPETVKDNEKILIIDKDMCII